MGSFSEMYEIEGTKKYNSVGGINPHWLTLTQERREIENDYEMRKQLAEERKFHELDLFSKKLESAYDFLKKHSSDDEDMALALKTLQTIHL